MGFVPLVVLLESFCLFGGAISIPTAITQYDTMGAADRVIGVGRGIIIDGPYIFEQV